MSQYQFCPKCGTQKTQSKCSCGFVFKQKKYKKVFEPSQNDIDTFYLWQKQKKQRILIGSFIGSLLFGCWIIFLHYPIEFNLTKLLAHDKQYLEDLTNSMFYGLCGMIVGFLFTLRSSVLTSEEYYALPSANNGQYHQCIFCGHGTLYTRTIYKTYTQIHTCPRCRNVLFRT